MKKARNERKSRKRKKSSRKTNIETENVEKKRGKKERNSSLTEALHILRTEAINIISRKAIVSRIIL